jgi:hypothetical protein
VATGVRSEAARHLNEAQLLKVKIAAPRESRHTRWRLAWHSGRMRWIRVLIGVALVVVGAVWALQGYGKLEGSFMTGSPVWMWIGIVSVVLGVVLLLTARPREGGRARRG